MGENVTLGVDIGGTKVAAGLVSATGEILFRTRVPMVATQDAATGFRAVQDAINVLVAQSQKSLFNLVGIGICSPGPLDPQRGLVLNPCNLPCWRDFPLAAEVERAYGIRARLDNDGNAAALAEMLWGAGAGYGSVFCVTLGTGIGTGIVLNKRILHGRTGNAAEAGHMTIDYKGPLCKCGKRGCIEALCAGPAIARRARERAEESPGRAAALLDLAGGDPVQIRAETVGQAFRQGDPLSAGVLQETADLLGIWLGNVIDFLDPEVVILGGGVSDLLCNFLDRIQEQISHWSINPSRRDIPLRRAKYGVEAGIAGAASLCSE